MRAYAKVKGEDEELWGQAGLLHDFDYEKFPEYDGEAKTGHPFEGVRELQRLSYPEELIDAVLGHALYSGTPRTTVMAKTLFAVDELSGFLVACAHMRPDRFETLEYRSVKKKLKDKSFAAKVSRDDIALGVQELGVSEEEHVTFCIAALKGITSNLFE